MAPEHTNGFIVEEFYRNVNLSLPENNIQSNPIKIGRPLKIVESRLQTLKRRERTCRI